MIRICLLMLAAFLSGQAIAAPTSPLIGVWVEVNGPGMARIEPCSGSVNMLCATGLDRRPAGRLVETGLVLSQVRPDGAARWRGTYHDGTRKLPATLRLTSPQKVQMRVCLFVICQTATYARTK